MEPECAVGTDLAAVAEHLNLDAGAPALARELARLEPGLDGTARRRAALGVLLLQGALTAGSTRLPLAPEGLVPLLAPALGEEGARREAAALAALFTSGRPAMLVGGPGDRRPLVLVDGALAPERWVRLEERLAAALRGRLHAAPRPLAAAAAQSLEAFRPPLAPAQRRAAEAALRRPLTLITGGPGTGKTTLVAAVVEAFLASGGRPEDVALAAPTGKAARRLTEALAGTAGPPRVGEARTLHRLLGYLPARDAFRHHRGHPLPQGLVVVDEASMIDLELMTRLLEALAPATRLVLLGDADQLPSVEAGAVFRDLVAAAPAVVRLDRSFRLDPTSEGGKRLRDAAAALRAGDPEWFAAAPHRPAPEALTFTGVERLAPEALEAFLDRWAAAALGLADPERRRRMGVTRRLSSEGGAAATELADLVVAPVRARLLALHRGGGRGAEGLNAALRARHLRALGLSPRADWAPGAPAVATRNDYERNLFNGDPGVVAWFTEGGRRFLGAAFATAAGVRVYPVATLRGGVEPAYALTVHKSQGLEFDRVAVVLPAGTSPLLCREVLYTALTRSRRGAVLLGTPGQLQAAATRRLERTTGLVAALRRHEGGG